MTSIQPANYGIIDIHTFLGKWNGVDVYSSVKTLLTSMHQAGIGQSIVITTNRDRNDYVLRIVKGSSGALHFALWFKPDSYHMAFLHKHRESVCLVKVHPSHLKRRLDDPAFKPLLKYCEGERLPMLVHCGRWQEMSGFGIALDVAREYELDFLLAHMGGVTRDLRVAAIHAVADGGLRNVYMVTSGPVSASPGQDLMWAPGTCPPDIVEEAVAQLGADKVIFGSDFPFGLQDQILECVRRCRLTSGEKGLVLGANARRVLHLNRA